MLFYSDVNSFNLMGSILYKGKTGKARLTEDERKLKELIDGKMVNYIHLSVQRISIAEHIDTAVHQCR